LLLREGLSSDRCYGQASPARHLPGNNVTERILAKGLEKLQESKLIDGTIADWANALRILGNEGAHYTGRHVRRNDAEDAFAFAEALLVLCKGACFSLGAFDAVQDLVGVLGPGEGARVLVPVVDVRADGVGELAD